VACAAAAHHNRARGTQRTLVGLQLARRTLFRRKPSLRLNQCGAKAGDSGDTCLQIRLQRALVREEHGDSAANTPSARLRATVLAIQGRAEKLSLTLAICTVIDQPFFFQVALLCAVLSPPPRHGARGHLLRDDLRLADHHGLQHPPQTALLLSCATHTHAPPLSCCPAASASAALCCSAALATRLRGVLCLPCVLLLHRALGGGARRRRRRNALQRPRQVRRTCYLSSLEPLHTARV
jgi:hypothetical protein